MHSCFNRHALVYRWPLVIYCVMIFVQSCFPSPEVIRHMHWSDKSLHLVGYALLGGLTVRMFKRELPGRSVWKIICMVVVACTLYGVSDELHQALVPGRHADIMDVVADMAGSALGAVLFWPDLPGIDRPVSKKVDAP